MNGALAEEFERCTAKVLRRFCAQNGLAVLGKMEAIAARLRETVDELGLPSPLRPDEMGQPGEMAPDVAAALAKRVLADAPHAELLATPVRQLVKACFLPEFRKCRDSYRAADENGVCRRQQFGHARGRVSGTHCVDCPYWIELTKEPHEKFLAKRWRGASTGSGHAGAADFAAHREVFLPEDFRALRRLVRELARRADPTEPVPPRIPHA